MTFDPEKPYKEGRQVSRELVEEAAMADRKVEVNGEGLSGEFSESVQTLLQELSELKETTRLERSKNSDHDSELLISPHS